MPLPWITLIAPCFHTRLWIGLSIIPSGERSPVLETWLSLGSGATWWSLSCPPLWWSQGGYNTGRDWLREASRFLELCISVFFCMFWGYIFYCTIKVWEKIMCCSHNCVVEFTSSLQSLLPFSIFIFNFQPPFFSSFSLPFPSSSISLLFLPVSHFPPGQSHMCLHRSVRDVRDGKENQTRYPLSNLSSQSAEASLVVSLLPRHLWDPLQ